MKKKNPKQEKNQLKEKYDPYFLLERFILKQRIDIINEIEKLQNANYKEIGKQILLQNLFLKKLRLDPGFRFTIYQELNQNKEILRRIKRELLSFFQESDLIKSEGPLTGESEKDLINYEIEFKIQNIREYDYPQIFTSSLLSNSTKKGWFYKKWREFMKTGKKPEAYASESLLMEFITGYYQGYYLFWTTNPYGENRNAYHHFLNSLREVVEVLNPFFLDYIESQRNNILVCELMQDIIDHFIYQKLNEEITEYSEHFEDMSGEKVGLLDKIKIRRPILVIASLLYFNSLQTSEKLNYLNQFYGIDTVLEYIIENPDFYDHEQYTGDLPIWYKFGFLLDFQPILERSLEIMKKESVKDNFDDSQKFILAKYLCKSLIEQKKFDDALQVLFNNYPFLEDCKEKFKNFKEDLLKFLNPNSRIQVELLYLLASIASKANKKNIVKFVISILKFMEQKVTAYNFKIKFAVLRSMLYRMIYDFQNELKIFIDLKYDVKKILKGKEVNPYEIIFAMTPPNLMASEGFHFNNQNPYMFEFESLEILEREPMIPSSFELYMIYADFRKSLFAKTKNIEDCFYYENYLEMVKIINRCHWAQSMASFDKSIRLNSEIEQLSHNEHNNDRLRISNEARAFPFLYLKQFERAFYYLNRALNFKSDDVYYNKYLIILHLFRDEYMEASKNLFKIYQAERYSSSIHISTNLKSLFQYIILWFKKDKFNKLILKMISETQYIKHFVKKLDVLYCDIGLSLADIGFFEDAIDYFTKALEISSNQKFRASILNNIGTVFSDTIQLDNAIKKFEKAIKNDPDNLMFWINYAKMHQFKLNYIKAKEIFLDAEKHFENIDEKTTALMHAHALIMDLHIMGIINLNIVHDEDALKHFKLAEQLVRNVNNLENLTENTGIIFIELSNGFDCCFHTTFSKIFLKVLQKHFPPNSKIPKYICRIRGLRELWKGNHMSIGNIFYLISELQKLNNDPIILELKNAIPKNITDEELKILQNFYPLIEETRNPGSHGEVLDKTIFLDNISKTIKAINEALIVFEKFYTNI